MQLLGALMRLHAVNPEKIPGRKCAKVTRMPEKKVTITDQILIATRTARAKLEPALNR